MKQLVMAAMILAAVEPLSAAQAQAQAQAPGFSSRPAPAGLTRHASSIATARELYAAARYDEALAVLDDLTLSPTTVPAEHKAIHQYRSLCLLALGRGEEAEAAIASVVRVDPFYLPGEAEASPRVRSTFADVRQRLLPDLAAARYGEAKQAYDRKAFAEAAVRFRELVLLLDDPQMNGRLPDLRTLAAGFVELAAAAAEPPPAPKEEPLPAAPVPPPAPLEPTIYTTDDQDVTPPVVVRQDVPAVPGAITGLTKDKGVIEVVIDEEGRVVSIALRVRLHPVYDTALLNAARDWKYKPATLNGEPVRYRKLLQISVKR
jgi:tetratricopeptide (TPR) repeat protein